MSYRTIELQLPEHRDLIMRLWNDNLRPSVPNTADARLRWLYEGNPHGSPRTVLAEHDEAHAVIGCGSVFPRAMWVNGTRLTAGILADFAVDRKHRLGGPALMIQHALCDASSTGFDFFFGFPNSLSLPIFKRVGYQAVGDATARVKPLQSAYKLKSFLKSELLGSALGKVVDAALVVLDWVRVVPKPWKYRTAIVKRADERFDRLWAESKSRYTVVGEKGAAFLNWRYAELTSPEHLFFTLSERATDRLLGYVCFRVEARKVFIVDLFAIDPDQGIDVLMMAFASTMRREHDSIWVGYVGSAAFGRRLARLGFFRSTDAKRQLLVFLGNTVAQDRQGLLLDENSWLIFDGDLDI